MPVAYLALPSAIDLLEDVATTPESIAEAHRNNPLGGKAARALTQVRRAIDQWTLLPDNAQAARAQVSNAIRIIDEMAGLAVLHELTLREMEDWLNLVSAEPQSSH